METITIIGSPFDDDDEPVFNIVETDYHYDYDDEFINENINDD